MFRASGPEAHSGGAEPLAAFLRLSELPGALAAKAMNQGVVENWVSLFCRVPAQAAGGSASPW